MAPKRRGNFKYLGDDRTRDQLRNECTQRNLDKCYRYRKAELKHIVDEDERRNRNVSVHKSLSKKKKQETYYHAKRTTDTSEDSETDYSSEVTTDTSEDVETYRSAELPISGTLEDSAIRDDKTIDQLRKECTQICYKYNKAEFKKKLMTKRERISVYIKVQIKSIVLMNLYPILLKIQKQITLMTLKHILLKM